MYMITLLLLIACDVSSLNEPIPKATPKSRHWGCASKKQGSTPACWTEQDWEVYCQRVQCKPQTKEIK